MIDEHETVPDVTPPDPEPDPSTHLMAVGATHVGQVRSNNEDFQAIDRLSQGSHTYGIWIVADGMGGGVRGEVASRMATTAALAYLREHEWSDPAEALRDAFRMANTSVFEEGTGGGMAGRSLMGTTLVIAIVEETSGDAWIANVGDSRAYIASEAELSQVTEDHSLVGERVAAGLITKKEANEAPDRNIVTRAIGTDHSVMVDVFGPRRLEPGETIILCSDGLHGMIDEDLILDFARTYTLDELPGVLIGAANDHGGRDNITVVAGGFRPPSAAAAAPIPAPSDVDTEVPARTGDDADADPAITALAAAPVVLPPTDTVEPTTVAPSGGRRFPRALMAIAAGVAALVIAGGGGALLLAGGDDGPTAADDGIVGGEPDPTATEEDGAPVGSTEPNDGESPAAIPSATEGGPAPTPRPTQTAAPEPTQTAAPTATPSPEPTATPLAPGEYLVREGDTCFDIGERLLLESGLVPDVTFEHQMLATDLIVFSNRPGVCDNGNPIVGEVITLPSTGQLETALSQLPPTQTPAPSVADEPASATVETPTPEPGGSPTGTETPERASATISPTEVAP